MEDNNKKEELTLRERISEDPFFLSSLSERATLLWYGSYALFNGILGVYHKSYWFISMAAWYLIIAGVRMFALKDNDGNQTGKAGTGICLLAIVLSGIVCMGIAGLPEDLQKSYVSPENLRRLKFAKEFAEKHNCSLSAVALAYLINNKLTCFPIIGAENVDMLKQSLEAADVEMTAEESDWLYHSAAKRQTEF